MRLKGCLLGLLLGLSATQVQAADGSSGCGPAWYVFKENSLVSSSLRNTTHASSGPTVTIGMTFGTSNCAKHKIVLEDKRSLHFASQSFDLLRQDIARASGPHLNAYIASFGCHAWARPQIAEELQGAYQRELYLSVEPSHFVDTTRAMIQASSHLQSACS